ncbi:hypothetical protein V5799_008266 [Amblyomma americanum]|uniref:Reverse transcriptase domain-containing protein n=1 Tax=Amblyomma americanum TaxID=6943 RepID=A0AAQ4FDR9_AMBAM
MVQQPSVKRIVFYMQHKLDVTGECIASCKVCNKPIKFIVVEGPVSPVLGRNACELLKLVKRVHVLEQHEDNSDLYNGLGCIKGFTLIHLKHDVRNSENRPPRKVPFEIRKNVKKELDNMEENGVIKKINEPTPFYTQMVIVKQTGKLRICLDPTDLNKILLRRHFPLKTLEEFGAQVSRSKYFTLLNLKKGFWQLTVSEKTQNYVAFSTAWGTHTSLRVPFGIATAPEVFQVITKVLKVLPNVANSMDNILIYAKAPDDLKKNTEAVQ